MTSTTTPPTATAKTASPASWLPVAAVAVTLVFWASAFVAIRHLGHDFSPGALSLGRLLVGAVCLGAVALSRGLPRPTGREWVSITVIGVLWFGVYNVALNEGEHRIDAGT
ncbi:MAG TPA: EamA family transporter, partial [Acidimicrobiales bacterium]